MDKIFYNGKVITIDQQNPLVQAVAVKNSLISAIGSNRDIRALKTKSTEMIDLESRVMLPGFHDSHLHLARYAINRSRVDLSSSTSMEEIINTVKTHIADNKIPAGDWVYGWGWNQGYFLDQRMPNRHDLDRASREHNIVIMRTCCHVMSVNTIVLEKAGINGSGLPVEGGNIVRDSQGQPTGVLKENAMEAVTRLIPPYEAGELKELIKAAAGDFLAAGLCSVQTDDLTALGNFAVFDLINLYRELDQNGELPIRVNLQILLPEIKELQSFIEVYGHEAHLSDYLKIGPLKLLTDGSFGGRTAFLSSPYIGEPDNYGIAVLCREEFEQLVYLAHLSGMQVSAHAIGDAAVNMVLDAFNRTNRKHYRPDPRFRIIHASMVDDNALKSFKEQGVIANIQPSFVASDYLQIDEKIGPMRAAWCYRWKDFVEQGIVVGGSSDCPVETYNPLDGICAALTRQDVAGNPSDGWFSEQRLDLAASLQAYTLGSAYSVFEEDIKGSITNGKLADLVVLSDDITAIEPLMIRNISVEMTVVGGNIVFNNMS